MAVAARSEAAWNSGAPRRRKFALTAGVAAALILGVVFLRNGVGSFEPEPGADLVAAAGVPSTAVSHELRKELLALGSDPRFAEMADVLAVELLESSLGSDPERSKQARVSARNRLKLAAKGEPRGLLLPEKLGWLLFEAAPTPDQRKWAAVMFGSATDGVRLTRAVRAAYGASEHDALNALLFKLVPATEGFDRRLAVDMLTALRAKSEAEVRRHQILPAFARAFPDDPEIYATLETLDDPASSDFLRVRSVYQRAQILVGRGEAARARALVRRLAPFVASSSAVAARFAESGLRRFADAELVAALRADPIFADRVELLQTIETAAKRNAQFPASSRSNGSLDP